MNNRILNEDEIIAVLVDKFKTMEILKQKDIEFHQEIIKIQQETIQNNQDAIREKYRRHIAKYRENHRDKLNAYCRVKCNQYYHANKEEINRKRAIKYKEKKEEKRLKDLAESLGRSLEN